MSHGTSYGTHGVSNEKIHAQEGLLEDPNYTIGIPIGRPMDPMGYLVPCPKEICMGFPMGQMGSHGISWEIP